MDWIYLAQDKAQYRLNTVKKLWGFHKIGGDFLSTWGNISFWTKTLLHGVSIPWSWNTGFFRGSLLYSLTSMPFVQINGVLCYGTTSTPIPLEVTWGSSTNAHILIPFELQVLKLTLPSSIRFSYVVGSIKLTSITLNTKKRPYGLQRLPDELLSLLNLPQRR